MVDLFKKIVLILIILQSSANFFTSVNISAQWIDPQTYSSRLVQLANRVLPNNLTPRRFQEATLEKLDIKQQPQVAPIVNMLAYSQTKLKPAEENLQTSKLQKKQQQQYQQQLLHNNYIQQQQQQQQHLQYLNQLQLQQAKQLQTNPSGGQMLSLKAKKKKNFVNKLSASRGNSDISNNYLRPAKYNGETDEDTNVLQRKRIQNYNAPQQQFLQQQRQLQQQNQQAYLNSINYPGQDASLVGSNYHQDEIHKLGFTAPQNIDRSRLQAYNYQYPELVSIAASTLQPPLPVKSNETSAAAVRLSNLKQFDLLKRKKPQAHVLASLRKTKMDEESDLINEAVGRLNRRTKKFKFNFQKSKDSDKLEIESNADAKLISKNKNKQELAEVNDESDQNNDGMVVVHEENAPTVVLIKKITRSNSTSASITTSTEKTNAEQSNTDNESLNEDDLINKNNEQEETFESESQAKVRQERVEDEESEGLNDEEEQTLNLAFKKKSKIENDRSSDSIQSAHEITAPLDEFPESPLVIKEKVVEDIPSNVKEVEEIVDTLNESDKNNESTETQNISNTIKEIPSE